MPVAHKTRRAAMNSPPVYFIRRNNVPLLFLPSNHPSRCPVELRVAAARVEPARPSGEVTQVSSSRSERALTLVVKTCRSLKPVDARATGRCRTNAGPPGAPRAVESSVGSRSCSAHRSFAVANASRLSPGDVPRGCERLVSSVSTDGCARLRVARYPRLPTVVGDIGICRRVRRGARTCLRP